MRVPVTPNRYVVRHWFRLPRAVHKERIDERIYILLNTFKFIARGVPPGRCLFISGVFSYPNFPAQQFRHDRTLAVASFEYPLLKRDEMGGRSPSGSG